MTADALKKITTDALDTLAELLDEGHSDQLTALLKTMARFHKYSFHNLCLITAQCPTATRVAGFQTWRTMGRFVRKGEKGIAILAPIVGRREAESASDNERTVVGFRAAYVFDVLSRDSATRSRQRRRGAEAPLSWREFDVPVGRVSNRIAASVQKTLTRSGAGSLRWTPRRQSRVDVSGGRDVRGPSSPPRVRGDPAFNRECCSVNHPRPPSADSGPSCTRPTSAWRRCDN